MAVAELFGVELDMRLLLKIGLSAVTVLLVSLAYRVYGSRSNENDPVRQSGDPQTCKRCKTNVTGGTEENHLGPSYADGKAEKQSTIEANSSSDREPVLSGPTKSGRTSRFLQKVEGGTGVGRELRQELEQHGCYSSFISKAEITVEDAQLMAAPPGNQVVHGKIYEYYVESSSQCTKDSNAVVGQNKSPPPEIKSHALAESPCQADPISTPLRKDSYLAAAEQSALPSPVPPSCDSTGGVPPIGSPTNDDRQNGGKRSDLEAVLLNRSVTPSDLERLKTQVDLGNCLEALFLAKKYDETPVVQAAIEVMSDNYLQVLLDQDLYGRLTRAERELIRRQRTSGRSFVVVADMNPRDRPGNAQRTAKKNPSALHCYDRRQDAWQQLCAIPPEAAGQASAVCTMDNYLFVAVGTDAEAAAPSKRVFCYNPLTAIWKEISPMNEARPRCKLAALDGYVYAIGGECLTSVERYDPCRDRWTFVAPLPNDTFAVAHHATVCNGELFVSGGGVRYMLLRYSPKNDSWKGSLLAAGKDRTVDMVSVGPFLYRFEVNPLLGVSVYRYHTVARLWYECDTKRLPRCPAFRCVAMDEDIYCVGRHFTLRFRADEISPAFAREHLSIASAANGLLFPFVLSLPDKKPLQTSV
ncbi:kelch domain-containing protein 7A [Stigmatopora argus]